LPIGDNEILLRRVSRQSNWWNPQTRALRDDAFRPQQRDVGGISLYREILVDARSVARGGYRNRDYFVVRIRVAEFARLRLDVVASDVGGLPGHVVVPLLNTASRSDIRAQNSAFALSQSFVDVVGPWEGTQAPPRNH
jgi:hypothetical protein